MLNLKETRQLMSDMLQLVVDSDNAQIGRAQVNVINKVTHERCVFFIATTS
jgi:hypothetical protein